MKGALGRIYALSGKPKEAQRILKELLDLQNERYISPFELASMNFALGQQEQGFDWLKKAFKDRCFELVAIKVDPRFDSLKNNTTFMDLASQLGLN